MSDAEPVRLQPSARAAWSTRLGEIDLDTHLVHLGGCKATAAAHECTKLTHACFAHLLRADLLVEDTGPARSVGRYPGRLATSM